MGVSNEGIPLLVLAGGFGTRLQSVVNTVPKPLAPVADNPFLYYQIEQWVSEGIRSIVFLLHHGSRPIIEFLQEQQQHLLRGVRVQWIVEDVPMGTGGAVANAIDVLGLQGDVLVANADTWLGCGASRMRVIDAPAMGVVAVDDASRYGTVAVDDREMISSFREKTAESAPGWINAGISMLRSGDFDGWDRKPFSLEQGLFPRLATSGCLRAVPLDGEFIDIGIPVDYHRFCRWIESEKSTTL